MKDNTKFTSETFIARWIAGELTTQEVDGLNKFMNNEPGAIQFFEEIKQAWFGTNPQKTPRGLSRDERWTILNKALNLKNESPNGKH